MNFHARKALAAKRQRERERAEKAPPVPAHVLGAIINALGELRPEQKPAYLALLVEKGRLTQAQADYVAGMKASAL